MPTYRHPAEESDYLHFSKGMWMKGVLPLQCPHFSDFCVHYSSAFFFLNNFYLVIGSQTIHCLVLPFWGELYVNGIILNIFFRDLLLSALCF